ncbi:S1/P1 nuclease [Paludibacterium yongneupense]|uniref:S1/P1 nuclease n=1 Tax=Paludibacterium yongneupense TaxID=400061 RepID=UPI00041C5AE1|nr:S1/P1 nuclease [Paludibacterium yongneupense]
MSILCRVAGLALSSVVSASALGWGAAGHQSAGAIADVLIAGSHAAGQTRSLLGPWSLRTAALWADCAKGVVRAADGYAYAPARHYPECAVFETPQYEAEMVDFVRRNDSQCRPGAGEEACHRQYHYSDIAWQRGAYLPGAAGSSDHDVVAAVSAAVLVLRGGSAPAPFSIAGPREALLLLAHLVGDMHQPLHVGAVYLDADGAMVDPDRDGDDPATHTRGGNAIRLGHGSLHALWDSVPRRFGPERALDTLLPLARRVAPTPGDNTAWPRVWADETVALSAQAFAGIAFGVREGRGGDAAWSARLPDGYERMREDIDRRQLARAGARLAQLLQTIWP